MRRIVWAGRSMAILALTAACTSDLPGPSGVQPPAAAQHITANFVFHYGPNDAGSIGTLAAAVETASRRVVSDLRAEGLRPVHVRYYDTHAAMAEAVRAVVPSLPAWAEGLVTGADQVHMLSPSRTGDSVDAAIIKVLHEFTHCVSLHLNPQSGNNPRWLWESVALYEAGQRVDPLPYLVAGEPPSLASLDSMSNRIVYDVGHSIGAFVVSRGGTDALRALILSRGDTAAVLGLSTAAFEAQWYEFVRTRYLDAR